MRKPKQRKPGARVEITIKTGEETVKIAGRVGRDVAFDLGKRLMNESNEWRKKTTLDATDPAA